jgi:UMF1 family MFS transporter
MKKNILLWSLYDFANSIIMIAFLFYFSQWLVVDSGKPDWWYNATLIISSAIFIVVAPFLARRLDGSGKKLQGLRIWSIILSAFYCLTAAVMLFAPSYPLLATVFFTLSMASYLTSFLYYTPMMNDLSTSVDRGWISGLGNGANYIGQVFGVLVTIPFATGAIYLFGAPGRAQTLFPAILLFALCALPLLLWYKEPSFASASTLASTGLGDLWGTLKKIISVRNLLLLFIAYFLFSDALLTFSNNLPIFLEKVFGVSDSVKSYLTAGALLMSAIGSFIIGKLSDSVGHKKTLLFILVSWVILFSLIVVVKSFVHVSIVFLVAGLFFGPTWAVSRALVADNTPREIEASSFGLYIVAERFATLIGPIVWSVILTATASQGTVSYSYAIVSMGALVLISLFFVRKIRPAL